MTVPCDTVRPGDRVQLNDYAPCISAIRNEGLPTVFTVTSIYHQPHGPGEQNASCHIVVDAVTNGLSRDRYCPHYYPEELDPYRQINTLRRTWGET